jgi:hypothetical protein
MPDSGAGQTLESLPQASAPPLLISYAFIKAWEKVRTRTPCRQWVLDSGAFTAKSTGVTIDREKFVEYALQRLADDPRLVSVFSLDVIGDPMATLRNTEFMWERGIKAIPTFHGGTRWSHLKELMRYPKIALGGVARASTKQRAAFASELFSRVWPKKVHGFGFGSQGNVLAFPWHSVDASSWNNPLRFGQWWSMGNRGRLSGSGVAQVPNASALLHGEVEHFARLERAARSKWRRTWQSVESLH